MVVLEVPADRVRAGIKAPRGELAAQLNDQRDGALGDRRGRGLRAARPRLERRVALGPIASDELIDPRPRHAEAASNLGGRTALNNDSGDHHTGLGHP